jgi:hypothetical protein
MAKTLASVPLEPRVDFFCIIIFFKKLDTHILVAKARWNCRLLYVRYAGMLVAVTKQSEDCSSVITDGGNTTTT